MITIADENIKEKKQKKNKSMEEDEELNYSIRKSRRNKDK